MSDMPAKGSPEGIYWTTAITSAATKSFDLTTWKGRWVKLEVDQDCWYAFSSHAHDTATGPGDFATSAVALGDRVTVQGSDVGYKVVKRGLSAGDAGVQRVVDPHYPWLLVRAKSTSTTYAIITPTSDKDGSQA